MNRKVYFIHTGTAYISEDIFDEYTYNHPPSPQSRRNCSPTSSQTEDSDHEAETDETEESSAFEIPLNTLLECLNIFGTAGPLPSIGNSTTKERKWRRAEDDDDRDREEDRRGPIDNYFTSGGKDDKKTGMRMSFVGAGYPLTLLM